MPNFRIVNTTRSRFNRTARYQAAAHGRFKQYVLPEQLRLVRGVSIEITEEQLLSNLEELREKWHACVLEVQTEDGVELDLDTLTAAEPKASEALPNFPLDSLADDAKRIGLEKVGQPIPQFEGGTTLEEVGGGIDGDPADETTETAPTEPPPVESETAPEGTGDPAEDEPAPAAPTPAAPPAQQHNKKKDRR